MKKILYAVFCLIIVACRPVLSYADDVNILRSTIDSYLMAEASSDPENIMQYFSKDFKANTPFGVLDYEKISSSTKMFKSATTDLVISDIKIGDIKIADNRATVYIEFKRSYFDINQVKDVQVIESKDYTFSKESDGKWRIIKRKRVEK